MVTYDDAALGSFSPRILPGASGHRSFQERHSSLAAPAAHRRRFMAWSPDVDPSRAAQRAPRPPLRGGGGSLRRPGVRGPRAGLERSCGREPRGERSSARLTRGRGCRGDQRSPDGGRLARPRARAGGPPGPRAARGAPGARPAERARRGHRRCAPLRRGRRSGDDPRGGRRGALAALHREPAGSAAFCAGGGGGGARRDGHAMGAARGARGREGPRRCAIARRPRPRRGERAAALGPRAGALSLA